MPLVVWGTTSFSGRADAEQTVADCSGWLRAGNDL